MIWHLGPIATTGNDPLQRMFQERLEAEMLKKTCSITLV
jgi:hypothetical protein